MKGNGEKRSDAGFSATMVNQCPLQTILKSELDYVESPADYHARWRGEGVHAMAEVHGAYPGIIQEQRIRKTINVLGVDLSLSGKPDWWDTQLRHLDDWKSSKKCPTSPYDDHKRQLNIYSWLIHGGTWDSTGEVSTDLVESASIVYIDPDRSVTVPVDLWSDDAIESMLVRRLEPYVSYQMTGTLPAGIGVDGPEAWKRRYCPFRGTGRCCGDEGVSDGEVREATTESC